MERIAQNPRDAEFVQNPYAFYDRLRRQGDIVFWTDLARPVATTYSAVSDIMTDRRLGRAKPDVALPLDDPILGAFNALESNSLIDMEPPAHTRVRSLVVRAFTSRRAQEMAPDISRIADELIDDFPPDAPFDLLAAYAQILPVRVIARLLGVPEEMSPQLLAWSNAMVAMYQVRKGPEVDAAAGQAARDFTDFLRSYIDTRRTRPGSDLLTALIAAEEDGTRLTTDELIATCVLLLNAGHEATVHSIGNSVNLLCTQPDPQTLLRPEAVERTVEEVLRYEPPLHLFYRQVYEDVELHGTRFSAGDEIGCLLASANRDDGIWPDAARFDPRRPIRKTMAFGAGIHFCVGAPLARLELQIALPLLFARKPSLRLEETPRFADTYHFRGLERLLVST